MTSGLGNRCTKKVNAPPTETYESVASALTPQWTPESPKQGRIDTQELPSDVAEIVTAWPDLPEHIKAAITTLVQAHGKGRK